MPGIIGPGAGGGVTTSGNPQILFANEVARQTGLDPRVVYVWTVAEGAYAPNGTGHYNFLNLRPGPGDVGSIGVSSGGFEQFGNLNDAITSTVNRIKQPFASGILNSAGKRPVDQLTAIGASRWDSGHYLSGGQVGGKLISAFASQYGQGALGGAPEKTPLPAAGGGASGAQTGLGLGGLIPGWLTDPTSWLLRGMEIIAGGVLVLAGLYLLARQIGLAPDAPTVVKTVAAVAR